MNTDRNYGKGIFLGNELGNFLEMNLEVLSLRTKAKIQSLFSRNPSRWIIPLGILVAGLFLPES